MTKWVLATHNNHKTAEFRARLDSAFPGRIELVSLAELGAPDIDETGSSFAENARLKAAAALAHTGLPSLADDSGLCVDALDGAPGIYSARYAGEQASADMCINKLLAELEGVPDDRRTARFVCALCLMLPDGGIIEVSGVSEGVILRERRGSNDFGYDPIFFYPPLGQSFAELELTVKNGISHRGNALAALEKAMRENRLPG